MCECKPDDSANAKFFASTGVEYFNSSPTIQNSRWIHAKRRMSVSNRCHVLGPKNLKADAVVVVVLGVCFRVFVELGGKQEE